MSSCLWYRAQFSGDALEMPYRYSSTRRQSTNRALSLGRQVPSSDQQQSSDSQPRSPRAHSARHYASASDMCRYQRRYAVVSRVRYGTVYFNIPFLLVSSTFLLLHQMTALQLYTRVRYSYLPGAPPSHPQHPQHPPAVNSKREGEIMP